MNLENILTFSTINIHNSLNDNDSMNFFLYFFAFTQLPHNPHKSLYFNHLSILPYSPHKISSIFFTKNSNFLFHCDIYKYKQFIIIMIFFILYFITIYLLVAVYPFFIKGMVQLVNDLSRITQFIILFIVTSICIIVKKWRKRKNNG